MAKQVKNKWLGARTDDLMYDKVTAYTDATDMVMGDLIREAISEYMINHPIKQPRERINLKPGE